MEYNFKENTCPVPKGTLLIIGGKEDKTADLNPEDSNSNEILKKVLELTEKTNPYIEIVTSASSKGEDVFEDYRKVFEKLEVKKIGHIHHSFRGQVINDDLSERVNTADVIFFSGGDQLMLTSMYGGSTFLSQLKERYIKDKIAIAGTSAGAMALSTPMIYAGNKQKQQITGEIKITTGLEFLKDVCIDTHFIDRSRFVRMAQVIATNPTSIGIGIEENTAVVVQNGIETEIIGEGVVTIIEGTTITSSNVTEFNHEGKVSISDLRVHLLAKGNKYNIPQLNPPHK